MEGLLSLGDCELEEALKDVKIPKFTADDLNADAETIAALIPK